MRRTMTSWSERLPRSLEGVSQEMENALERLFGGEGGLLARFRQPPLNLAETDSAYEVTIELPGMKAENVGVEFREGQLIISGERQSEPETPGKKFHRVERSYGSFRRAVSLPGDVDEDRIDAEFHDGVLLVTLPKSIQQQGRQIHVRGQGPSSPGGA